MAPNRRKRTREATENAKEEIAEDEAEVEEKNESKPEAKTEASKTMQRIQNRKNAYKAVAEKRAEHFARSESSTTPTGSLKKKSKTENGEEEEESWPGPWSTAALMLQKRAEARKEREEKLKSLESGTIELLEEQDIYDKELSSISQWNPNLQLKSQYFNEIPTLNDLCCAVIGRNMSYYETVPSMDSFLSTEQKEKIMMELAKARNLDGEAALTLSSVNANTIVFPDCSLLDEETMMKIVEKVCFPESNLPKTPVEGGNNNLDKKNKNKKATKPKKPKTKKSTKKYAEEEDEEEEEENEDIDNKDDDDVLIHHSNSLLQYLILKNCGRGFTDRVAALLYNGGHSLESIELAGCYRLSDSGLAKLLEACSARLQSLKILANSRISSHSLQRISLSLPCLRTLSLDYNTHLTDSHLELLFNDEKSCLLSSLEEISLRGLIEVTPQGLEGILRKVGKKLKSLDLSSCNVNDLVMMAIREHCVLLSNVTLENLDEISTTAWMGLFIPDAFQTQTQQQQQQQKQQTSSLVFNKSIATSRSGMIGPLEIISFQGSSNITDEVIIQLLEVYGRTITSLNLNGCHQLTNRSLAAIWLHSAENLHSLNLSFVRLVTEEGLGTLLERCWKLRNLFVWGMTQLSKRFYHFIESSPKLAVRLKVVGRISL
jgi:hypothetical protein